MDTAALIQEFEEEFWPNVPRGHKIGRGLAKKAYIKARKIAYKDEILAGLPGYRQYEIVRQRRDGADFRPLHPATWLNQERWLDEIVIPGQKKAMPPCACGCGREAKKSNLYAGRYWHLAVCYWDWEWRKKYEQPKKIKNSLDKRGT